MNEDYLKLLPMDETVGGVFGAALLITGPGRSVAVVHGHAGR